MDFCYCDISNWYFWQVCGWSFILGLQIIVIIITHWHEFKFWLVSVFFFPFIFYSFRCLLLLFFISPCFYCLSCLLNLSNYKHQKNVGLVIIQRVVMRCSIEGRQKTVSNSLVSISEIKANLWLSAFWFFHCTCICCGSNLIFGLNFFNLGTNNGGDFPQESLLAIYNRIKKVQYLL